MTFAQKIISFCKGLNYSGPLPAGINIMNPFRENDPVVAVISEFYKRNITESMWMHLLV
jgi:hypothetical protein